MPETVACVEILDEDFATYSLPTFNLLVFFGFVLADTPDALEVWGMEWAREQDIVPLRATLTSRVGR